MNNWHPTWIEINTSQFRKNIQIIRNFIGAKLYCLPVKADAYGHGLVAMGKIAAEEGVDYLAVAHANEGVTLRKEGICLPIFVMGAIHKEQIEDLLFYDLEISVSSELKANLIRQECKKQQKQCKIHLEVDTGMHRTGMRPETASRLYEELINDPFFKIIGIYSHFASTESAQAQMERFHSFCQTISSKQQSAPLFHIGNSSGILTFRDSHLDMVRPALLSFGYGNLEKIAPCFSLKSKISYCKIVEKGEGISYNHTFYTQKRSKIVTVPIGYGDGYRRDLSNKAHVLIRGKKHPIVGTICMDQFMVDVNDDAVCTGDEVVLIGKQGDKEITISELASLCNTIPYELLCGFNHRVPRVYL